MRIESRFEFESNKFNNIGLFLFKIRSDKFFAKYQTHAYAIAFLNLWSFKSIKTGVEQMQNYAHEYFDNAVQTEEGALAAFEHAVKEVIPNTGLVIPTESLGEAKTGILIQRIIDYINLVEATSDIDEARRKYHQLRRLIQKNVIAGPEAMRMFNSSFTDYYNNFVTKQKEHSKSETAVVLDKVFDVPDNELVAPIQPFEIPSISTIQDYQSAKDN